MGKHRHHDHHDRQTLSGTVRQPNISPKGRVEGVLLDTPDGVVQVNLPPDAAPVGFPSGAAVTVVVEPDHHAAVHDPGDHPVYLFVGLAGEGETDGVARVEGTVARLNYARHGEPNGVVLDTGDFAHLKPDGMRRAGLTVGRRVEAEGTARPAATGGRVIEAVRVNGMAVGPKKPHHHE